MKYAGRRCHGTVDDVGGARYSRWSPLDLLLDCHEGELCEESQREWMRRPQENMAEYDQVSNGVSGLQPRERNGRILNTGKALGVLEREVGPLSVQEIMGGYQVRVEQQPSLRDSAAPHESGVSQIQCRRWTSLPKQH
jgi:hypothetical protein